MCQFSGQSPTSVKGQGYYLQYCIILHTCIATTQDDNLFTQQVRWLQWQWNYMKHVMSHWIDDHCFYYSKPTSWFQVIHSLLPLYHLFECCYTSVNKHYFLYTEWCPYAEVGYKHGQIWPSTRQIPPYFWLFLANNHWKCIKEEDITRLQIHDITCKIYVDSYQDDLALKYIKL